MIERQLGPGAVFHRFHTPKWASEPLSGMGAASVGGRFNRPGVEALYLAAEMETAHAEYRQGASIAYPATYVGYRVALDRVVDLTFSPDLSTWRAHWQEWTCEWKRIYRIDRKVPPSWLCADEAISGGCDGILYPSMRRPGGTNLVIYPANARAGSMQVYDPSGALPKDRSSWDS